MQVKGKRVLKNGALAGYVKQRDGSWKWRIIKGPKKTKGGYKEGIIQQLKEIRQKLSANPSPNLRRASWKRTMPLAERWKNKQKSTLKITNNNVAKLYSYLDNLQEKINNICGEGEGECNTKYKTQNVKKAINEINRIITLSKNKETFSNKGRTLTFTDGPKLQNNGGKRSLNIEMFEFLYGPQYRKTTSTLKPIKKYPGNNKQGFYNGNRTENTNKKYSPFSVYSGNVITHANNNNTSLAEYPNYHKYYKEAEVLKSRTNTVKKNEIEELIDDVIGKQFPKYEIKKGKYNFYMNNKKLEHGDAFIYKFDLRQDNKVIMFGDFHGSFHTFFRLMLRLEFMGILTNFKLSDGYYMVFCGDILDRGQYALEIVTFILRLINKNPERVIYNRGNHEVDDIYNIKASGQFSAEMNAKGISAPIKEKLKNFFTTCPSAVILQYPGKKIWCCHGGIPYFTDTMAEDKERLLKYMGNTDKCILFKATINEYNEYKEYQGIPRQIRWNDLTVQKVLVSSQQNSLNSSLGRANIDFEYLNAFFKEFGIYFLIRGHQDSFANNTLFYKNNDNYNIRENGFADMGTDVDKLIVEEQNITDLNIKNFSQLHSIHGLNVNPVARFVKNNEVTDLVTEFTEKKTSRLENQVNDGNKPIQALTISTNTDQRRLLFKDSFIIVSCDYLPTSDETFQESKS